MRKIWFKAKNYGWGWYPVTIQGWVVVVGFVVSLLATSAIAPINPFIYTILVLAQVVAVTFISYKKGEKPEWRWAGKKINLRKFLKK